jgi:methylglyoxal synthase
VVVVDGEAPSAGGHNLTVQPLLALIAHDGKKDDMLAFAGRHRDQLSRYRLIATGTTGALIAGETGLEVERVRSGPKGGDVQIAARIIADPFAAVFFFVEPMDVHPHDPDIQTLLRTCNIENVPLATNEATGDLLMKALG